MEIYIYMVITYMWAEDIMGVMDASFYLLHTFPASFYLLRTLIYIIYGVGDTFFCLLHTFRPSACYILSDVCLLHTFRQIQYTLSSE